MITLAKIGALCSWLVGCCEHFVHGLQPGGCNARYFVIRMRAPCPQCVPRLPQVARVPACWRVAMASASRPSTSGKNAQACMICRISRTACKPVSPAQDGAVVAVQSVGGCITTAKACGKRRGRRRSGLKGVRCGVSAWVRGVPKVERGRLLAGRRRMPSEIAPTLPCCKTTKRPP